VFLSEQTGIFKKTFQHICGSERETNNTTIGEVTLVATNTANQTGRNRVLVSGAEQALNRFKMEIATELGLDYNGDKGNLTSRQNGYVGGTMVKRMIEQVERQLSGK
jgi:hypothetical protein